MTSAVRSKLESIVALALLAAAMLGVLGFVGGANDRAAAAQIAELARPGDVRLVSSVDCVFCAKARAWLDAHRVPYAECFIERDAACAADYRALLAPGTPVVIVRGQAQRGFDPARVAARLAQTSG